MAIVFGTKYDANVNEFCTNTVPDVATNIAVDTAIKKFGAGSAKLTMAAYHTFASFALDSFNDIGAIGFWIYFTVARRQLYRMDLRYLAGDPSNQIVINVDNYFSGACHLYLSMRDTTATVRVNVHDYSVAPVSAGWHYVELNWLWNDAGGYSKLSWDGSVKISNTGGNAYSRSSGTTWLTNNYFTGTAGDVLYIDDWCMFNALLHSGDFLVPTESQCTCGVKRLLTLGSPFGMNSMGK
jgi:hypothetical protein